MGALFDKPRLFGHRGDSEHHTENTLAAFEACVERGIDGIELDVQRTLCGTLVVFHDFTLQRMAGIERRIDEMAWEELREIPIGDGARIPTLKEVFSAFGTHLIYDIELKARGIGRTGLEEGVIRAIEEADLGAHVLVSSFNPVLVWRFKRLGGTRIPTAVIYSHSSEVPTFLQDGQGRFLARPTLLKPEQSLAHLPLSRGEPTLAWTVDDEGVAKRLLQAGAVGIITNRPTALAHLFRG